MKLLFYGSTDVHNVWGQLSFGATQMGSVALPPSALPDPFQVGHCRRLADGSYAVIGYVVDRQSPWQIYRAITRDGFHFEEVRQVFATPDAGPGWHYAARVAYSPSLRRYLFMKNVRQQDVGYRMYVFLSEDGESWTEYDGNPVFDDGDSWGVLWSEQSQQFIYYGKGWQHDDRKRVNELALNARRVVTVRTSPDGVHWTPNLPSHTGAGTTTADGSRHGMRIFDTELVTPDYQISLHPNDPEDLEFYVAFPFEYEGRYFITAADYAGSFLPPGFTPMRIDGHGQAMGAELWTSHDGLHWERPFMHAMSSSGGLHNPMLIGDRIIWCRGGERDVVPADRICYTTAWSNAVFESASFLMPAAGLTINVRIPADGLANDSCVGYVMAELVDDANQVPPGYDSESCIMEGPLDQLRHPLRWGARQRDGGELAGNRFRVRFYLRAAQIYALCSTDEGHPAS